MGRKKRSAVIIKKDKERQLCYYKRNYGMGNKLMEHQKLTGSKLLFISIRDDGEVAKNLHPKKDRTSR